MSDAFGPRNALLPLGSGKLPGLPGKFPLGRLVGTAAALAALDLNSASAGQLLKRHQEGDWGDLSDEARAENDACLRDGGALLSSYRLRDGTEIWVFTEGDRSVTTVLLPDEY